MVSEHSSDRTQAKVFHTLYSDYYQYAFHTHTQNVFRQPGLIVRLYESLRWVDDEFDIVGDITFVSPH